ncbi:hypothetical protein SDC9_144602 [bioreactor metagenome]|uniref:Uncharacterized protein n=1 Tax=bioreactor metagenome TaxID=1076179 RepID=A0A645E7E0_9ZZZZ
MLVEWRKGRFADFYCLPVPWPRSGIKGACLERQISFGHIFTYFVVHGSSAGLGIVFHDLNRVVGVSARSVVFTLLRSDAYAVYGCASVSA